MEWLKSKYSRISDAKLKVADARQLGRFWPGEQFDLIAFEGFLGPQRGHVNWQKVMPELAVLDLASILEIYNLLKPGARLVMALPYVVMRDKTFSVEIS